MMTMAPQYVQQANDAIWCIPNYIGTAAEPGNELTTGGDLAIVINGMLLAIRQRKADRAGDDYDENLDSFRTYGQVFRQLELLMAEPEDDEFGRVRPAESAVAEAKAIAFNIAKELIFPSPEDISTDHDGAIRISWRKSGRFLELIFPYEPNVRPYLYYSEGPMYDIEDHLSPANVRRWLMWIEGASRPR